MKKGNILRNAKNSVRIDRENGQVFCKKSSLCVLCIVFFPSFPGIRHYFVNQLLVMTDTSAGYGSKLNWRSEVTLHGGPATKLDAYLTLDNVCVQRGRASLCYFFFFFNFCRSGTQVESEQQRCVKISMSNPE